jgi:hypothetical protein
MTLNPYTYKAPASVWLLAALLIGLLILRGCNSNHPMWNYNIEKVK